MIRLKTVVYLFPRSCGTKPKAASGQVQMILHFEWLFNRPFIDVRTRVKIAWPNDEYNYYTQSNVQLKCKKIFLNVTDLHALKHVLKPKEHWS